MKVVLRGDVRNGPQTKKKVVFGTRCTTAAPRQGAKSSFYCPSVVNLTPWRLTLVVESS